MSVALPPNEDDRLEALYRFDILDTVPEQAFDDITLLASQLCSTKTSTISLIDRDRQWFKSKVGSASHYLGWARLGNALCPGPGPADVEPRAEFRVTGPQSASGGPAGITAELVGTGLGS